MNEFFTWNILGTYAGAVAATALITQILKELPGASALPTRLFSYAVAALVLLLASFFGEGLSWSGAALALVNAVVVALAANGAFDAVQSAQRSGGGESDA